MYRPASYLEASVLGYRRYFTGRPCKYGHVAERFALNCLCTVCHSLRLAKHKRLPASKTKARERRRVNLSANPGKFNAWTVKRRASKLKRTPPWANLDEIREVYELAAEMTLKMGEPMDVDHEIPLRGKLVSGLHVYENLQIIPRGENRSKQHRYVV